MKLISALLVRNENAEDRYLKRVLQRCQDFSDGILVLDDGSTDGTQATCRHYGAVVYQRDKLHPAWGDESSARKELWDLASSACTSPDHWVLINDADQELIGDVRGLCLSRETNAWSFVLYDLWSEREYREDEYWRAHTVARPWLFAPLRVPSGFHPDWGAARQIHTGHFPPNMPLVPGIAPPDEYYWKHWAYSTDAARKMKHAQYAATFHLMSDFEKTHADSILQ